ncbi:hypothetical protein HBI71_022750 [Parastagonospora nodorum]|nr:hypothetical protein HBI71_022750 [Parastagonospora nodorum]
MQNKKSAPISLCPEFVFHHTCLDTAGKMVIQKDKETLVQKVCVEIHGRSPKGDAIAGSLSASARCVACAAFGMLAGAGDGV